MKPGPLFSFRKITARWRNRGPKEVMSVGIERLRAAVSSSDTLIFLSRPAEGEFDRPRHDAGLELVEATAKDGKAYENLIGTDSAGTFAQRLASGTRCFLVKDSGTLLHASWVTRQPVWTREIRRYFSPPPGDAYVYESFTTPEARGRGVYPFALIEICTRLSREHKGLVWVGVEEGNVPSRKAIAKGHFTESFSVRYARKLGFLRVDEPVGAGVKMCFGCIARSVSSKAQVSRQGH